MARKRRSRRSWVLALVGAVAVAIVTVAVVFGPPASATGRLVRAAAMMAYLAVFLASVSSIATRELVRIFGRPFVKVHHVLAISGLIMTVLHPTLYAFSAGSPSVFVPVLDSVSGFLRWGGRLAIYLFLVAAVAAAVRKALGRSWRLVHGLNYVAFVLVTIHAVLIGTDFQSLVSRIVVIGMAAVIAAVAVYKRVARPGRRPPRAG